MVARWSIVAALALSGCASWQEHPNEAFLAVAGTGAGALIGSRFGAGTGIAATTLMGAAFGAILGDAIGRELDRAHRPTPLQAVARALDTGAPAEWRDPDTGRSLVVTPGTAFNAADGAECRAYRQSVTAGGKTEEGEAIACRRPDGGWKIVG